MCKESQKSTTKISPNKIYLGLFSPCAAGGGAGGAELGTLGSAQQSGLEQRCHVPADRGYKAELGSSSTQPAPSQHPASSQPAASLAMPPVPDMTDTVPAARAEQTLFLLGGYTDKSVLAHAPQGGEGSGFYSVIFDPEVAKFQRLTSSEVRTNPAFIMKHPELDVVYMTTEVITKDGSEVLVGKLDRSAIASRISDVFSNNNIQPKYKHAFVGVYCTMRTFKSITGLRSTLFSLSLTAPHASGARAV